MSEEPKNQGGSGWKPVVTVEHTDADEFLRDLRPSSERWQGRSEEWCFRGHANAYWPLTPTLLRHDRWTGFSDRKQQKTPRERLVAMCFSEYNIWNAFMKAVDDPRVALHPSIDADILRQTWETELTRLEAERPLAPGRILEFIASIPPRPLWPQIALVQHYGAPTRFLDWSELVHIAAYFAAKGATQATGTLPSQLCVWALRSGFFSEALRPLEEHHRSETLLPEDVSTFGRDTPSGIEVVLVPRDGNPNLTAQHGIFVLDRFSFVREHGDPRHAPLEYVLENWPKAPRYPGPPLAIKFTLPFTEAPKLLRLLAYEGVDAATVFPGLHSVAEALRETQLWDHPRQSGHLAGWKSDRRAVTPEPRGGKTPDPTNSG